MATASFNYILQTKCRLLSSIALWYFLLGRKFSLPARKKKHTCSFAQHWQQKPKPQTKKMAHYESYLITRRLDLRSSSARFLKSDLNALHNKTSLPIASLGLHQAEAHLSIFTFLVDELTHLQLHPLVSPFLRDRYTFIKN